jgi:hypothetical protein
LGCDRKASLFTDRQCSKQTGIAHEFCGSQSTIRGESLLYPSPLKASSCLFNEYED